MNMNGIDLAVEVNLDNSDCTNHSKIALHANEIEVKQALKYLLRHAIKVSKHGSSVRLQGSVTVSKDGIRNNARSRSLFRRTSSSRVGVEQVSSREQQHLQKLGYLTLSITDTGPGISLVSHLDDIHRYVVDFMPAELRFRGQRLRLFACDNP